MSRHVMSRHVMRAIIYSLLCIMEFQSHIIGIEHRGMLLSYDMI